MFLPVRRLFLRRLALQLMLLETVCHLRVSKGHDIPKEPLLHTDRQSESCLISEGFFTCTDHSQCLHLDHVCDAIKDCGDKSDEGGKCDVKCTEGACGGKCHPTPLGPYCLCPLGKKISSDNVTCVDINECDRWPPVCDQLCDNTEGSFTCLCAPGYHLADDQHHCHASVAQPGRAVLIYTQESSIMMLEVGHGAASSNPVVVYHARGPIYSLALDAVEERIFWFSSDDHEIKAIGYTQEFSKNTVQRIVTNGLLMVNTMAYDWVGKNLYLGDALLHRIIICSVLEQHHLCATMFTSNVLHVPRSLVIDPNSGKLYWSECGRSKKIESASMDGSNTITLVHDEVYCPNSLYIDTPTRMLYWIDPDVHMLESISVLEPSRRHKYTSKYITSPVQLAVFEEEMYVAHKDKSTEKVLLAVANKYKYNTEQHQPMLLQLSDIPNDMHIYHKATQMSTGLNPCSNQPCTGGLCVLTDRQTYKCLCPHGKRLDVSLHNCVWNLTMPSLLVANGNRLLRVLPDSIGDVSHDVLTLTSGHNITALAYDQATQTVYFAVTVVSSRTRYTSLNSFRLSESSEVKRIFEGVGWITDISIDWVSRNIYWCDSQQGVIEMSRMDGSSRTVILNSEQIQEPNAISVDPMDGKLYYSDCGAAPHVGVCDMDGTNCYIQSLGSALKCVSDLFIDYTSRHLYWTDSTLGVISVTDLHQFSSHEIRHSPGPVSISLFGNDLYWLDNHYGDVLRQPKMDAYHDTRIKLGAKPLTDLVALDHNIQPTGSNGCSGPAYGGCSHLCIAKTRLQSVCVCPTGLVLSASKKTCVSSGAPAQNTKPIVPTERKPDGVRVEIAPPTPSIINRPPKQNPIIGEGMDLVPKFIDPHPFIPELAPQAPVAPNPWEGPGIEGGAGGTIVPPLHYRCPVGLCVNGDQCKYKHHQYYCVCNKGWTGKHCEVRLGPSLNDNDDDDDDDNVGDYRASTGGQSRGGLVAGLVILVLFLALLGLAAFVVYRTQRGLRPGESFSFTKLRYGVVRKTRDPKLETLINPSCTDIVDNIYTDVNDIIEHNQRKKIKPPSLSHSQSLDSVQSACKNGRFP